MGRNESNKSKHFKGSQFFLFGHLTLVGSFFSFSPKAPLYNMTGHMDKVLAVDWSIPSLMMSGGADNQLKIFQYQDIKK